MASKMITLRKISTGGILLVRGKSVKDVIKSMNLDPSDWEDRWPAYESEGTELGDNKGDAGP